MTFLRQLLFRAGLVITVVVFALMAAITYYFYVRDNVPPDVVSYMPSKRIEQHQAIADVLMAFKLNQPSQMIKGNLPGCTDRQLKIIDERIADLAAFASHGERKDIIGSLQSATSSIRRMTCREFLLAVDRVIRILTTDRNIVKTEIAHRLITQSLTEDVAWGRALPCLFWGNLNERVLLKGPLAACYQDGVSLLPPLALAPIKVLSDVAFQRYANEPLVRGPVVNRASVFFTGEPTVQRVLNTIAECSEQLIGCNPALRSLVVDLDGASVVVTDPNRGGILGVLCFGRRCKTDSLRQFGHLAALMIETPMASTAKLFFALTFAQDKKISHKDLEFQLKTSGQLDALAIKRNEWWERNAICDGHLLDNCPHASRAQQIASELSFNKQCDLPSINCGRVVIMPNETRTFAFVGRFTPGSSVTTRASKSSFISWETYDSIRQGIRSPNTVDQISYANTSSAVQSVIGAGDSRISALGLAVLSANLYRLSLGAGVQPPSLLVDVAKSNTSSKVSSSSPLISRGTALVVFSGMRRVMGPAEPGWVGDGTGHRAFSEAFGRSCGSGCPIAGKTGTVSLKDPNFPGTTLFTALANLEALRGKEQQDSPHLKEIAIGVIAFPKSPRQLNSGHLASRLGMQIVREILEER